MIRRHENSVSFKAGALSFGVHAALLIVLLVSVNWKTTHTPSVAEVELWDSLPQTVQKPVPPPEPVVKEPEPPKPVEKVEPPEPKIEPKADITVKKIEKKIEKPKEVKKPDALAELKKQMLEDAQQKDKKPPKEDAVKKLAEKMLAEDMAEGDKQAKAAKSAASDGEVNKYKTQIQRKIQQRVIKTLCGDGNPKLVFEVSLITVTGELQGHPKLIQSSKITPCDDTVERAILEAAPFDLPKDASLREQFRTLTLEFYPNK